MRRVEWWWFRPSSTTGCRDNRQNVYKIVNSLTFCRLSRHPVVLEERNYHHSTRRIELVRMVVVSSFYHHSLAKIIGKTSIKFAKTIIGKSVSVSVLLITEPNRTDRSPTGG